MIVEGNFNESIESQIEYDQRAFIGSQFHLRIDVDEGNIVPPMKMFYQ